MPEFLFEGPKASNTLIILAPGAGAPMTSPWMSQVSALLAEARLRAVRFDFRYMSERQRTGSRRPPPKAEKLVEEYDAALKAIAAAEPKARIFIGGKSLGGRVASLAAQSLFDHERIAGLVCLGYPFHPPDKPESLRTAHLMTLTCPALIVQGERDPFGGRDEVATYGLPPSIGVHWARDGDHDLSPRRASGATLESNLRDAVSEIVRFTQMR